MPQYPDTDESPSARPVWMRTPMPPGTDGALEDGERVEVCVVGAGVAGLTTAYELCKRGFEVLVLDGGRIAHGESRRTTAHLASALDDRCADLERRLGTRGAWLLVRAHDTAIDWIERFCRRRAVRCGFRRVPGFRFESGELPEKDFEDELAACARAGLDVDLVGTSQLPPMGLRAIRYGYQAQVDAGGYLRALAEAALEAGARICESTIVESVEEGSPSRVVLRDGRTILAKHVVCATGVPLVGANVLAQKQAAFRSYVVAFEVPKGSVPRALYWDMEDPYHYVRVADGDDPEHDLLLVGGEDRRGDQEHDAAARFALLEAWAQATFPVIRRVSHRWSGRILEPVDGVGFVGRAPGSEGTTYVITGDSGHGMTLGTLGGLLVADLIQGRPNEASKIFDPSRSIRRDDGFTDGAAEGNEPDPRPYYPADESGIRPMKALTSLALALRSRAAR